jgi:hypothetical protein
MRPTTLPPLALLCALALALAPAQAQDRQKLIETYVKMCMTDSVNMPAPLGESDLKGNPKLEAYCRCFSAAFAERALALKPEARPPTLDEATKQELAMRSTCRQKLGLPAARQ